MAFSTEIDHWPVEMQVRMCPPKRTAVKNTPRWDRAAMKDVSLGDAFRSELQSTLTTRAHDLDGARRPFQRLQLLNDIVREVGSRYYSPPMCGPRKQWVSQRAFELMKEAWTAKDELRDSRRRLRHIRWLFPLFRSWQAAVGHLCDSDVQGCAADAMSERRKAKREEASCLCLLRRKQMEKRSCLESYRETHWRAIANSAEAADRAGDARSTYRLFRALGAVRTTTLPGIKLADGSFALDSEEESERWNEHFAALLCGNLVEILVEPPVPVTPASHEVEEAMDAIGALKDEVQRVVTSLPSNKALGKDMIPAELWKAGCEVT